tara:strand:- start:5060 stop:5197 length:138 start_codon:yes stop_codon:yes gene_type:complete
MHYFTPQELRVLIAVLALLTTGLVVQELRDAGLENVVESKPVAKE